MYITHAVADKHNNIGIFNFVLYLINICWILGKFYAVLKMEKQLEEGCKSAKKMCVPEYLNISVIKI